MYVEALIEAPPSYMYVHIYVCNRFSHDSQSVHIFIHMRFHGTMEPHTGWLVRRRRSIEENVNKFSNISPIHPHCTVVYAMRTRVRLTHINRKNFLHKTHFPFFGSDKILYNKKGGYRECGGVKLLACAWFLVTLGRLLANNFKLLDFRGEPWNSIFMKNVHGWLDSFLLMVGDETMYARLYYMYTRVMLC